VGGDTTFGKSYSCGERDIGGGLGQYLLNGRKKPPLVNIKGKEEVP